MWRRVVGYKFTDVSGATLCLHIQYLKLSQATGKNETMTRVLLLVSYYLATNHVFRPEDWGSSSLQNINFYTVSHRRRLY
jgi:hypothetical protein